MVEFEFAMNLFLVVVDIVIAKFESINESRTILSNLGGWLSINNTQNSLAGIKKDMMFNKTLQILVFL